MGDHKDDSKGPSGGDKSSEKGGSGDNRGGQSDAPNKEGSKTDANGRRNPS